jgi:hypothetical protein
MQVWRQIVVAEIKMMMVIAICGVVVVALVFAAVNVCMRIQEECCPPLTLGGGNRKG